MNKIPTRTVVYCSLSFEGLHRFKDAPQDIIFLRDWHRHMFHVKLGVEVTDQDREVEFIMLKRRVTDYVRNSWEGQRFELSCEQIAQRLLEQFNADMVEVDEDHENGCVIRRWEQDE